MSGEMVLGTCAATRKGMNAFIKLFHRDLV